MQAVWVFSGMDAYCAIYHVGTAICWCRLVKIAGGKAFSIKAELQNALAFLRISGQKTA